MTCPKCKLYQNDDARECKQCGEKFIIMEPITIFILGMALGGAVCLFGAWVADQF